MCASHQGCTCFFALGAAQQGVCPNSIKGLMSRTEHHAQSVHCVQAGSFGVLQERALFLPLNMLCVGLDLD